MLLVQRSMNFVVNCLRNLLYKLYVCEIRQIYVVGVYQYKIFFFVFYYFLVFVYSLDCVCYLEVFLKFVEDIEFVSILGNKSKGEDMDVCLEEVNKDFKVWQYGSMVVLDWL